MSELPEQAAIHPNQVPGYPPFIGEPMDTKIQFERGYPVVYLPREDGCRRNRKRKVHQLVWEKHHGPIPEGMVLHHVNLNKLDWRLENLQLMTKREHHLLHSFLDRSRHGWVLGEDGEWAAKPCKTCKRVLPLSEFHFCSRQQSPVSECKPCRLERSKRHRDAETDEQKARRLAAVRERYWRNKAAAASA